MVFETMDLDGNGTIELDEFLEFLSGKVEADKEMKEVTSFACALCRQHLRKAVRSSSRGEIDINQQSCPHTRTRVPLLRRAGIRL